MRLALVAAVLTLACGGPNLGRVRPQLQPPDSPIAFGTLPVLNEKRLEVPLLNVGRADLAITNVALATDDGVFRIVSAPSVVQSGNTETIVLAFVPLKEQAYANTLSFETDDPDNAKLELPLSGTGSTRAVLAFEPPVLDFGRVPECSSAVQQLTVLSKGTADLIITSIAFSPETPAAFTFVGSTRTPATVKTTDGTGLPGQILLTVRLQVAAGSPAMLTGAIVLKTTDPDQQEVSIPLKASINRAPVATIAMLGNASPGQLVPLDGSGSMDPDGDTPLTYRWTLRSKPLSSGTSIDAPTFVSTSMRLDSMVPGAYEVQLDVTDSTGVKSCAPARATVVAAPAQKLLVELFWDNAGTDLDLHVTRTAETMVGTAPDDCFFQNRAPDWGVMGDPSDDPQLVRDALTGYGPEVFGYVNPIDTTYRVHVVFNNALLSTMPASTATVRVYLYGVLKAEVQKTMMKAGEKWPVVDVTWPSGDIKAVP